MLLRRLHSTFRLFYHHQKQTHPRYTFLSIIRNQSQNHQVKDPGVASLIPESPTADLDVSEFAIQLSQQEMEELTAGDEDLVKKIKYIQLEHEVYRQEGLNVPSTLKLPHWRELLTLPSPSTRKKYYNFLFLNEMKSLNAQKKKDVKTQERLLLRSQDTDHLPKEEDPNGTVYGLNRNTLFLRLYDTTVNRFHHNKIIQAMQFGPPLILDCGYDEFMTPREAKNCAKQIEIMLAENRVHNEPFDLRLCNAPKNGRLVQMLLKINPALLDDNHPVCVHEESYLDIFPRKKLVYLSPHAREELEEYCEDEVYIIGAMVDKADGRPLSLAKAKREGLKLKKLPLDKYLVWGMGGKSLTVNQMVGIMLDLRKTGDWRVALEHVPKRKLNRDFHPYEDQQGDNGDWVQQKGRNEGRSQVMEDHELMKRRRERQGGFGGGFGGGGKYSVRGGGGGNEDDRKSRFNVKSIFEE